MLGQSAHQLRWQIVGGGSGSDLTDEIRWPSGTLVGKGGESSAQPGEDSTITREAHWECTCFIDGNNVELNKLTRIVNEMSCTASAVHWTHVDVCLLKCSMRAVETVCELHTKEMHGFDVELIHAEVLAVSNR